MDRSLGKPFLCRQLQTVSSPHAAQTTQCQMTISLAKIRGRLEKIQDIITLFCLIDPICGVRQGLAEVSKTERVLKKNKLMIFVVLHII